MIYVWFIDFIRKVKVEFEEEELDYYKHKTRSFPLTLLFSLLCVITTDHHVIPDPAAPIPLLSRTARSSLCLSLHC
ncbi:unnamed protein product [Trifolium pratense]|uniref:Uncharacterized protein n=1 Tax=Trifolium pratense TaxID=57577 RepID=A0ACB0J7J3_TRIPR|nr:unnamed protein product [Trifolium pratense]